LFHKFEAERLYTSIGNLRAEFKREARAHIFEKDYRIAEVSEHYNALSTLSKADAHQTELS
jgi:transposase-like protein